MRPATPKPSKAKPSPIRDVKIPTLKFSTRNKSDAAYRDRLKVFVKTYGKKFSFPVNAKLIPQRKAAITRVRRTLTEFLNPKNRFVFVPLTPALLKKSRKTGSASKNQYTNGGVFVATPKTTRKKSSVNVDKKSGVVSVRTGKSRSTTKLFRTADVVNDPATVVREAKRRGAETIFVTIKGHRGVKERDGYSLKAFMQYLKFSKFGDDLREQMEEDEENRTGAFKNFIGIEFVSHEWKRPTKPKRKK